MIYNMMFIMKDADKFTMDALKLLGNIDSYCLTPLRDSICKKNFTSFTEAFAMKPWYLKLTAEAVRLCQMVSLYRTEKLLDTDDIRKTLFVRDDCTVDVAKVLEDSKDLTAPVVYGDLVMGLCELRSHIKQHWIEMSNETAEALKIRFWDQRHLGTHRNLADFRYFLVRSLGTLVPDHNRSPFDDIPVCCSLFDAEDPWYYQQDSRRILLVYDTAECAYLGGREYDCTSCVQNTRDPWKSVFDEYEWISAFSMPPLWDFDCMFQLKPWVSIEKLKRVVKQHDPNDVGEVIVQGPPCAIVVVRKPGEKELYITEDITIASMFMEIPVYGLEDGRLYEVEKSKLRSAFKS